MVCILPLLYFISDYSCSSSGSITESLSLRQLPCYAHYQNYSAEYQYHHKIYCPQYLVESHAVGSAICSIRILVPDGYLSLILLPAVLLETIHFIPQTSFHVSVPNSFISSAVSNSNHGNSKTYIYLFSITFNFTLFKAFTKAVGTLTLDGFLYFCKLRLI